MPAEKTRVTIEEVNMNEILDSIRQILTIAVANND